MENTKTERTKCEIYSRIVGYIRPVSNWNVGKRAEFDDRKRFIFNDEAMAEAWVKSEQMEVF